MKKTTLLLVFVLGMGIHSAISQDISDLINSYFTYNRFWGSVLITQNGKIVLQESYGYADMGKNLQNTAATMFSLASVTKTMTAAAILKLHDEGKLSVYDKVDKYIPGFVDDNTDSITLINLLNHTSGMISNLSHHDDLKGEELVLLTDKPITLQEMIGKFKDTKLISQPGTKFDYNNYGYIMLAYIIEKVSGMNYLSYLNEELFTKASMTNTFSMFDLPNTGAQGYVGIGSHHIRPVINNTHPSWYTGAAGIYSSTADLLKFLQSVFSHQLFSEKTLRLMLDTCIITYKGNSQWSLGWQKQVIDGLTWYSHGGSIEGFSTRIGYLPEKDICIVILSNLVKDYKNSGISSVNFSFVDEIAEKIINMMNGKHVSVLPIPIKKADTKLVGSYELDPSHVLDISLKEDSLFLTAGQNANFTLFDYSLNREIQDTSINYKICQNFTACLLDSNFTGFEKFATEELRKGLFNDERYVIILDFWQKILSRFGRYLAHNTCNKAVSKGNSDFTDYTQTYHLEKADVIMQITFNKQGLISGYFVLKIIPKCEIQTVNLIPTGKNEYFVDGYHYGGYGDFSVKYNEAEQTLSFTSADESFAALRIR
jgi:CubicO group peptidase (beta-lactamase class C family)